MTLRRWEAARAAPLTPDFRPIANLRPDPDVRAVANLRPDPSGRAVANVRQYHAAGGRRGKERAASLRAEQRLAAGGRRLPRPG
jgi:hypothetical protein